MLKERIHTEELNIFGQDSYDHMCYAPIPERSFVRAGSVGFETGDILVNEPFDESTDALLKYRKRTILGKEVGIKPPFDEDSKVAYAWEIAYRRSLFETAQNLVNIYGLSDFVHEEKFMDALHLREISRQTNGSSLRRKQKKYAIEPITMQLVVAKQQLAANLYQDKLKLSLETGETYASEIPQDFGSRQTEIVLDRSTLKRKGAILAVGAVAATSSIKPANALETISRRSEANTQIESQLVQTSTINKTNQLSTMQHKIAQGDTLYSIANRYGVELSDLTEDFENPELIFAGRIINIPKQAAKHTIAPGDTLANIALSNGTTVDELVKFNAIQDKDLIKSGNVVFIPAEPTPEVENIDINPFYEQELVQHKFIDLPQGLTVSDIAKYLIDNHTEIYGEGNHKQLVEFMLESSEIEDPSNMSIGADINIGVGLLSQGLFEKVKTGIESLKSKQVPQHEELPEELASVESTPVVFGSNHTSYKEFIGSQAGEYKHDATSIRIITEYLIANMALSPQGFRDAQANLNLDYKGAFESDSEIDPKMFMFHWTGHRYNDVSHFVTSISSRKGSCCSVQYFIDQESKSYQLTEKSNSRASHAKKANNKAIGAEIEAEHFDDYTPAQIEEAAYLALSSAYEYDWPIERSSFVSHSETDPDNKIDPPKEFVDALFGKIEELHFSILQEAEQAKLQAEQAAQLAAEQAAQEAEQAALEAAEVKRQEEEEELAAQQAAEQARLQEEQAARDAAVQAQAALDAAALQAQQAAELAQQQAHDELISRAEGLHGADAERVQLTLSHLTEKHPMSTKGAIGFTANIAWESAGIDPCEDTGDGGKAYGVVQWHEARRPESFPYCHLFNSEEEALVEQLDFALEEMKLNYAEAYAIYTSENPTLQELERASKIYEGYQKVGNRMELTSTLAKTMGIDIANDPAQPLEKDIESHEEQVSSLINFDLDHPLIKTDSLRLEKGLEVGDEIQDIHIVEVAGKYVHASIAMNVARMLEAADKDGIDLSLYSGWRSHEHQAELRVINGCPDIHDSDSDTCRIPTAAPGRSNHNGGNALDLRHNGEAINTRGNKAFIWLDKHAEDYGFYNLPSEPWHWSVDGR